MLLATRTREPPSRSMRTRVGLPLASSSITLEMWIGPSRSMIAAELACRVGQRRGLLVLLRAHARLTMFRPSTYSAFLGRLDAQHAARSCRGPCPPITLTWSPERIFSRAALARGRCARHHSTSGASETIFMKLRSRSSRATGPNTRVPRGLFWSSMITAAFSSKAM